MLVKRHHKDSILTFLLLGMLVLFVGRVVYVDTREQYRGEVERQLAAVAELKVSEIVQWRRERVADANMLHGNHALARMAEQAWADPPDALAAVELQNWLERIYKSHRFLRILLLDNFGVTRVSIPDDLPPVDELTKEIAWEAFDQKSVAFNDLHRHGPDQEPHLSTVIPLMTADGARPVGLLALMLDPGDYLYPLLDRWPTSSETAGIALVRRDGDTALILNNLTSHGVTAFSLRIPVDQSEVPAVRAILGEQGFMTGLDARGEWEVAYVLPVPDSPWFLVTYMQAAEAYAPLRLRMWLFVLVIALLLVGGVAIFVLFWRQKNVQFLSERLAVEEERAWLREMIERSDYEFYVFHPETMNFVFANQGACHKLGYTEAELFKLTPIDLLPEFIPGEFRAMYEPLCASQEGLPLRAFHRCKDGTTYPTESYLQQVATRSGNVILMLARDITESVQQEKELIQRTSEMERFTYTMSHELKTPLVTVGTYLGYLEYHMDPHVVENFREEFKYMRAAMSTMRCMLDDLLDMARIGYISHSSRPFFWQSLVSEVLERLSGIIDERRVTVQVEDVEVALCGDRPRLMEVLQNLVENAVKYMGEQPVPRIDIGVERRGVETVFYVRDNGIGIMPHYHEKVFGMFEKLNTGGDGIGMGLALSKRIVELYNGVLWLTSEGENQGCCFYFTLPDALTLNKNSREPVVCETI